MIHRHVMQGRLVWCACWLAVVSLMAQEVTVPLPDDPDEVVELGTVVIEAEKEKPKAWAPGITTATRSSVPLNRVPQSIQVLSRELIKEQDAQTLGDALTNVSGVVPVKTYQSLILSPLVRGFAAELFVDGMPGYSTTSSMDTATLVNVQALEVIKGPTAALFGGGVGSPLAASSMSSPSILSKSTSTPLATAAAVGRRGIPSRTSTCRSQKTARWPSA